VTAGDGLIVMSVEANAFQQHMVRNFAGVLLQIGMGQHAPAWAAEVLAHRQRERGGVTAPPDGLYLATVRYAAAFDLPPAPPAIPLPAAFSARAFD
ncbi:MAG: hypothetical protein RLW62_01630, partial [Gammaproteobacteria bacterium]